MNPERLLSQLEREPFVPIRLNLTDGSKVDMQNPGPFFINNLALYLARIDRPNGRRAADVRLISLRHIVSVEQIGRKKGRGGGKAKLG
jgi:hypothetical protein